MPDGFLYSIQSDSVRFNPIQSISDLMESSLASSFCPSLAFPRTSPNSLCLRNPRLLGAPLQTPGSQEASISCTANLDEGSSSTRTLGSVALAASVAVTLFFTDPALAFKGGGPYGQEVTRGLDLSGRDFSGKTLIKQDFKASNLRQVNFRGAKLLGASFFDANLTGADLTDADLRGADLSLANAAKANFTNANLEGALVTGNTTFKGATITGADFTDVLFREDQRAYLCQIADGVNSVTGNATRDTIGCN